MRLNTANAFGDSPYAPEVVTVPLPANAYGIEVAQAHAAMADDLLTHAKTLEEDFGEDTALEVYEQATSEFFIAHSAAGGEVEELGPEFFEGLAEAEEAIATADVVPAATREIALLHSISSIDQALSMGGISKARSRRLRSRQHELEMVRAEISDDIVVNNTPHQKPQRPRVIRLRESRSGHKINGIRVHTETIVHVGKELGARVLDRLLKEHTQEIPLPVDAEATQELVIR